MLSRHPRLSPSFSRRRTVTWLRSLIGCLRDPANVQQMYSKHARIVGRLLEVCWMFAESYTVHCICRPGKLGAWQWLGYVYPAVAVDQVTNWCRSTVGDEDDCTAVTDCCLQVGADRKQTLPPCQSEWASPTYTQRPTAWRNGSQTLCVCHNWQNYRLVVSHTAGPGTAQAPLLSLLSASRSLSLSPFSIWYWDISCISFDVALEERFVAISCTVYKGLIEFALTW